MADQGVLTEISGLPGLPASLLGVVDHIESCVAAAAGEPEPHRSIIFLVKGLCNVQNDLAAIAAETEEELQSMGMMFPIPSPQPTSSGGGRPIPR